MIALKKVLSVFIALFLIFFAVIPLFSASRILTYQIPTDNLKLYSDNFGSWMISFVGSECHIEKLCPNVCGAQLQLNHSIADAGAFKDTVVALCNDEANYQLEVYTYRPDTDILDSFAIASARLNQGSGFYYDGTSVYIVSDNRSDIIKRYSTSGTLLNSYSFDNSVLQIGSDFCGNIFAVSADTLYRLDSGRFTAAGGCSVTAPVHFFSDNLLSDAAGRIISVNGGSCSLIFRADADFGDHCACLIDDIVYYPDGSRIYGYDRYSGIKQYVFEGGNPYIGLFSYNVDEVCALFDSGSPNIISIPTYEFTSLKRSVSPADIDDIDPPDNEHSFTPSSGSGTISSSVYRIDFDTYSINDIPEGTTLAQLKRNISYDGFTVRFFREGSLKKSGVCGTAMLAVFDSADARYTFELSVLGDITGEGSVNKRDLKMLARYLLGSVDFNGVYYTAADISHDGILDALDLAMLHRML